MELNKTERLIDTAIDVALIAISIWAYGKFMYWQGKVDAKEEMKKEEK